MSRSLQQVQPQTGLSGSWLVSGGSSTFTGGPPEPLWFPLVVPDIPTLKSRLRWFNAPLGFRSNQHRSFHNFLLIVSELPASSVEHSTEAFKMWR